MQQNFFQQFTGWTDASGQILTQTFQGAQVVGVTFAKFQEAQKLAEEAAAKAEGYHKQLVDAGIIKPKLTAEEQIAALAAQVATLTELITAPAQGKEGGR